MPYTKQYFRYIINYYIKKWKMKSHFVNSYSKIVLFSIKRDRYARLFLPPIFYIKTYKRVRFDE